MPCRHVARERPALPQLMSLNPCEYFTDGEPPAEGPWGHPLDQEGEATSARVQRCTEYRMVRLLVLECEVQRCTEYRGVQSTEV